MTKSSMIHGLHAIKTALKNDSGNLKQIWIDRNSQKARLREIKGLLEKKGVKLHEVDHQHLNRLSNTEKHQGIVAEYFTVDVWTENKLYALLDKLDTPPFLLILDGITDPHNLGACLRTAEGAGVHAVIAPKNKASGITPTVRKVASGAAEYLPFIPVTNLVRTLETLKKRGIWLIGTSDKAQSHLYAADLKGSIAFVMGSEGKGLRHLTEKHCDLLVSLPMAGKVPSLNVSVATGICLYEVWRQQHQS